MPLQQKNFSDLITFSRASAATRWNAQGVLETVAAGVPRIDYDPVTLAVRGLLIEEQRTNLALWSTIVSAGNAWSASGGSYATGFTAPDANFGAALFTADGTSNIHFCVSSSNSITYTSGTTYALSKLVRAESSSLVQLSGPSAAFGNGQYANFSLTGAGSVLGYAGLVSAPVIAPLRDGWYRITIVVTATATATTNGPAVFAITSGGDTRAPTNNSTGSFYVWGSQPEPGAFSTSLIVTGAAQATRAADGAAVNTLSPWFNASEGTLYSEFTPMAFTHRAATFNDGTSNNAMGLTLTAGGSGFDTFVGGAFQGPSGATGVFSPGTTYKMAGAYALNNASVAINGNIGATDTTYSVPAVTQLLLGQGRTGLTQPGNGWLRRIRYYRTRLDNATLQALTA